MTDDILGQQLSAWLKGSSPTPPDATVSARAVLGRLREERSVRRGWSLGAPLKAAAAILLIAVVGGGALVFGPLDLERAEGLAVDEPSPGEPTADACVPPDLSRPSVEGDPSSTDEPGVAAGWQEGRWQQMSRAPFGTSYGPAVWTGERLLVMEPDNGRTATYDPERDHWREVATAPRHTETFTPSIWTGSELVITEVVRDTSSVGGLAYDPATDRWRELARMPFAAIGRDHGLTGAIWTGTHIVVVEVGGLVAALDVAADCWTELGEVPGDSFAQRIYRDGPTLLIESGAWRTGTSMRRFDPVTGAWSGPAIAPFDVEASWTSGSWVGDELVYLTWARTDDHADAGAVFDPATMTWTRFEHDCTTSGWRTNEAGGLLLSSDGRRAFDPATRACVVLPKPTRPLNGTESVVWTGRELIAWGGIRSLPEPSRRGGTVYRPASTAGE